MPATQDLSNHGNPESEASAAITATAAGKTTLLPNGPGLETKERFKAWWHRSSIDRPLLRVIARREQPTGPLAPEPPAEDVSALYLDVPAMVVRQQNMIRSHHFLAESYPSLSIDLGPGSLALYLGSEPVMARDTLWYREVVEDWQTFGPLHFDDANPWWQKHLAMARQARKLAGDGFLVNIPDLIENVDILSALRGPQAFCYDLIDQPDLVLERLDELDQVYFAYYDAFYDIVREADGGCSYTAFAIWGPGRTAKVQCDFSAMMSPEQFRYFVQPSLRRQCQQLDFSLYHLDGPDAIRHLDALMAIDDLDALQWTSGAGKPDGGAGIWYPIYDQVRSAGKSLWISIYDDSWTDWVDRAGKLVRRYGADGLYLLFPAMSLDEAQKLLAIAERSWH